MGGGATGVRVWGRYWCESVWRGRYGGGGRRRYWCESVGGGATGVRVWEGALLE